MSTAPAARALVQLDRRFEAVVLIGAQPDDEDGLVTALREAGVRVVTVGPGIVGDDLEEAVARVCADLWRLGIDLGGVLLVAGGLAAQRADLDPLLHSGLAAATLASVDLEPSQLPPRVVALADGGAGIRHLLANQVRRHHQGDVPAPAAHAGWGLVVEGFDPEQERADEARLALADGHIGISGAPLLAHSATRPWVLAHDLYVGDGPQTRLLTAPAVFRLPGALPSEARLVRLLDLHSGLLYEDVDWETGSIRSVRFTSLARPGTAVLRVRSSKPVDSAPPEALLPPTEDPVYDSGSSNGAAWMRVAPGDGGVVTAVTEEERTGAAGYILDRFAAYHADADTLPEPGPALERVAAAASAGFDALLDEHRQAWASRWEDADITIEGDPKLQLATRFALFHLMATVPDTGEAAVGARGLSGHGYRGHVFWDADTFVLPFLAATHPPAARAMLEYRLRRLNAALAAARASGRGGARFPWESARTGRDVTPTSARDRSGRLVAIRTGQLEEHIVAQVPWAACFYADWTGDEEFANGPGLRLLVETARYWASRIRIEPDGSAHIYGVIGPDEYHEPVDDNAFTNVMARWNLRRAAAAVERAPVGIEVEDVELRRWEQLAGALVDSWDPDTGIYEQFAGFHNLEPLIIAEVAPRRPIAADMLLGPARVHRAQVLKQPDVLMLHHLVPDEVRDLDANLRYYEPRTAHGSSLSPSIHASLLARARDYGPALEALNIGAGIDLDDLTGSTAGGLHVATMGGLWQAFAFGFTGLRPRDGRLTIDPRLPRSWSALELRVRFRGRRMRIRSERRQLTVTADAPVGISVDGRPFTAGPRGLHFRRTAATWELTP